MISPDSLISFARLEYSRNTNFRAFVEAELAKLHKVHILPQDALACLSLAMTSGRPLAQALLEAYHARGKIPQWREAKEFNPG